MNIFYFFYSQFICDLRDKKSYFKHTAEILIPWVFTSTVGEGMGGGGGGGGGQVSSWDLPFKYQGGERSPFKMLKLLINPIALVLWL